jgi:hypothetical protein
MVICTPGRAQAICPFSCQTEVRNNESFASKSLVKSVPWRLAGSDPGRDEEISRYLPKLNACMMNLL